MPVKRIVLRHTTGPYAGLRQIVGHLDDFGGQLPGVEVKADIVTPTQPDARRHNTCRLVSSFDRYLLYEEVQ